MGYPRQPQYWGLEHPREARRATHCPVSSPVLLHSEALKHNLKIPRQIQPDLMMPLAISSVEKKGFLRNRRMSFSINVSDLVSGRAHLGGCAWLLLYSPVEAPDARYDLNPGFLRPGRATLHRPLPCLWLYPLRRPSFQTPPLITCIISPISLVEELVFSASFLTFNRQPQQNPFPCSPARAASMVALKGKKIGLKSAIPVDHRYDSSDPLRLFAQVLHEIAPQISTTPAMTLTSLIVLSTTSWPPSATLTAPTGRRLGNGIRVFGNLIGIF